MIAPDRVRTEPIEAATSLLANVLEELDAIVSDPVLGHYGVRAPCWIVLLPGVREEIVHRLFTAHGFAAAALSPNSARTALPALIAASVSKRPPFLDPSFS